MAATAIGNGSLRESVRRPRLGEQTAKASGLAPMWVLSTLAFEFGFGRHVARKSWPALLSDYNLFACRIWRLVC